MKFLLFTIEYPPFYGGVANYYGNLVKHWPQNNIEVLHYQPPKLFLLSNFFIFFKLYFAVKQKNINYVIVGNILPLGTGSYILSKFIRIKYSIVLHGTDFNLALKSQCKKKITRLILKNAHKIICANSYLAELVRNFLKFKKDNIVIVNPGVNHLDFLIDKDKKNKIELLKNKYNIQEKLILLSIGRLVARKGFDKVIESLPQVIYKIPNFIYVIIGNGPELDNLKSKVTDYNLDQYVLFLLEINDEEKKLWLRMCDIFIMPSREINGDFEGFGIVYLEAGAARKPVIAGASGGVRDAVINNKNGLLVDPINLTDISRAIIILAENKELRENLGINGYKLAVEFDWKTQTEKFYQIINS